MKKKIFIIILVIILLIILLIGALIIKPKYELNKSIKMINEAKYSEAYIYINNTKNEENKKIIKELISMILLDYMTGGIEQMTLIANKGTEVIQNTDLNNIDYSADDTINIFVKKLNDYIEIKNKIPKEMIIKELAESYNLYFEILEFVNANFVDLLNKIENEEFMNKLLQLAEKSYIITADITSIEHNYKFSEKTHELYKEINL